MRTSDFDYHLPKELIAQTPAEPRDHSRLMVVSRADGSIQHRRFYDLIEYLLPGDVLVFNDSRVMPARLHANRTHTGARVELLLLHRIWPGVWRALVRPGRRMGEGDRFQVFDNGDGIVGEVLQVEADGSRVVSLSGEEFLDRLGEIPLPPYIHQPLEDVERYQTVYSREPGSVAAPTAGLHFTLDLMESARAIGVELVFVTLNVGGDSFRPVKSEDISSHELHAEYFQVSQEAADAVNSARREGRRVISVGTTAVRLLEQVAVLGHDQTEARSGSDRGINATSGWANLFIYPGHRFRIVDSLVTNFHLPRSTLLMLTCAFAGRELVMKSYREATEYHYRFYSLGDAMLIM